MLGIVLYECGDCNKVFGIAPSEEDSFRCCPYCEMPSESAEFIEIFTLTPVRWSEPRIERTG